jgi:cysteine desulfurase / selenocysteine lyase
MALISQLKDGSIIDLSRKRRETDWLLNKRLEAFKLFNELSLPEFRHGLSIFMHPGDLAIEDYDVDPTKHEFDSRSNGKIIVMEIGKAMEEYGGIIREHFKTIVRSDEDKITALNTAFFNKGILVYIPKDTEADEAIVLNSIMKDRFDIEYTMIIADENSRAKILGKSESSTPEGFKCKVVEIFVKDNACLEYGNIQNLGKEINNFEINRAVVSRNGVLNWSIGTLGSRFTRQEITTILRGEGSSSNTLGLFFGDNEQKFDTNVVTVHEGSHTKCDMINRGIVRDKAKSLYRGLIDVKLGAYGVNGYQKDDTLILSEEAEANSVPKLQIGNNDVRCSHGATIGQIDKNKLFYLMSRGLSESEAVREIISGFFEPLIIKLNEDIKEEIRKNVNERMKEKIDFKRIIEDFPILDREINGKRLVYLDNAATSQKPRQVIEAVEDYYKRYNANVNRGLHKLSEESTVAFEEAHKKIAKFINARDWREIIFTKNATESLNLAAYSLSENIKEGDEILVSEMEHHSNFVPWQQIAKMKDAKLKLIEVDKDGKLKLEESLFNERVKVVAVTHMSNVLGSINNIKRIAELAHKYGAIIVVDGAQSVPHFKVDVQDLDCDLLAFSGHKMLGPMGVGVLYGKRELLEKMRPFIMGGGMINEVSIDDTSWAEIPEKFEAGTPNVEGAIGLAKAIDYLNLVGMDNIEAYETELTDYAYEKLSKLNWIDVYGGRERGSLISFNVKGVHAHDVSTILDQEGIAVRGGNHCAMPLMNKLGITGSVRASFYFYNTKEDVDILIRGLEKVGEVFKI